MDTTALAKQIKIQALRLAGQDGSSHIGPALAMADIIAVVYGDAMKFDPSDPD